MAHFYGSMKGSRGEATKTGGKKDGITAHIRGYNVGIRVNCWHDEETGQDICEAVQTGGSNRPSQQTKKRLIAKGRK